MILMVVEAQGINTILTLATKGWIYVQDEPQEVAVWMSTRVCKDNKVGQIYVKCYLMTPKVSAEGM